MPTFSVAEYFQEDGCLAQSQAGYRVRQAQVELAEAIEKTIAEQGTLVAEAGTGTGKTWAYLVPAFTALGKVLVSTGTRTLQDQLFRKDVPALKKAMGTHAHVVLLKGRSNYVCHFYLNRLENDPRGGLRTQEEVGQLREIKVFMQRTKSGDKTECTTVPESADIWHRVTSTRESCLNQDCPYIDDCFVNKARRAAQEADVVVINHALYFSDLAMRKNGQGEFLPQADTVIFDEAHQIPETATNFLGNVVSMGELMSLLKEVERAMTTNVPKVLEWDKECAKVGFEVRELRIEARDIENLPGKRVVYEKIPNAENVQPTLDNLVIAIGNLCDKIKPFNEKHTDILAVHTSLAALFDNLHKWAYPHLHEHEDKDIYVRWIDYGSQHMRFSRAPLSVKSFGSFKRDDQAWIFTSATLTVNHGFDHFTQQLGLYNAQCKSWDSPFNYQDNALLYVPQNLPDPRSEQYNPAFVKTLLPFIKKTPGGVLILCTTLRAVDTISDLLTAAFVKESINRPVMRQGESTRGLLMQRFRDETQPVLVGSASFWEGVDFPGELLTLVAIDKLPFAPPDDPVLEARMNECKEKGGNPFMQIQIPEAVIALKQGAGRLIRTEQDRGVLIVGDGRLVEKFYSKLLWRSLPDFYRTRDAEVGLDFWP